MDAKKGSANKTFQIQNNLGQVLGDRFKQRPKRTKNDPFKFRSNSNGDVNRLYSNLLLLFGHKRLHTACYTHGNLCKILCLFFIPIG